MGSLWTCPEFHALCLHLGMCPENHTFYFSISKIALSGTCSTALTTTMLTWIKLSEVHTYVGLKFYFEGEPKSGAAMATPVIPMVPALLQEQNTIVSSLQGSVVHIHQTFTRDRPIWYTSVSGENNSFLVPALCTTCNHTLVSDSSASQVSSGHTCTPDRVIPRAWPPSKQPATTSFCLPDRSSGAWVGKALPK